MRSDGEWVWEHLVHHQCRYMGRTAHERYCTFNGRRPTTEVCSFERCPWLAAEEQMTPVTTADPIYQPLYQVPPGYFSNVVPPDVMREQMEAMRQHLDAALRDGVAPRMYGATVRFHNAEDSEAARFPVPVGTVSLKHKVAGPQAVGSVTSTGSILVDAGAQARQGL